jgi:hypothetical protein
MSWLDFETSRILSFDPKELRERGLEAARLQKWSLALAYLNQAARHGVRDLELLDALGEAAYKTDSPEALGPWQNYYKYPLIAPQMARAFLMLGDLDSAREFLGYSRDCALKSALLGLIEMGPEIEKSVAGVLPVAERHPDLYYPEYWRALSAVADSAGRMDLVHLSERKSKAYAYNDPNIHFNQALRLLGKGEFRAAWRLYDWRLVPGAKNNNRTQLGDIPMWEGESLRGKKLLIFLEQGLGDCLFSLRYVEPMQKEGAIVEVVARKPLMALVRESFPGVQVYDEDAVAVEGYWDEIPNPDYWVYSLSIPHRAGLWQPINTGAFLKVPASARDWALETLSRENPESLPVYTINWHGRIDTPSDRTRAFSVEEFAGVSGILNQPCFVVSLQLDATQDELSRLKDLVSKSGGKLLNAAPLIQDFAHTAGWIAASKRLLTCDTSVSHVGGAIGHPTTVLARNRAIWQWLRKSDGEGAQPSLWYDSVVVEYALSPEISWLFTTLEKKELKKEEAQSDGTSMDGDKVGGQFVGGNAGHFPQFQPGAARSRGFERSFRFAGRTGVR